MKQIVILSFLLLVTSSPAHPQSNYMMEELGWASDESYNVIRSQDFMWLPSATSKTPQLTVQHDGTLLISTPEFSMVLSSNGTVIERNLMDGTQVNVASFSYAPFDLMARPVAIVQNNQKQFVFTEDGVPIPQGGLEGEARAARDACIEIGNEKIEEARLMDAVLSPVITGYGADLTSFLLKQGVDPANMDEAIFKFTQRARNRSEEREAKYRQEWERVITSDPTEGSELMSAEDMGREAGPFVLGGLLGYAAAGTGRGLAAGAGVVAARNTEIGETAGAAYGRSIDRTGQNPFVFGLEGNSPRPDHSVFDSMREAFDKIWDDDD